LISRKLFRIIKPLLIAALLFLIALTISNIVRLRSVEKELRAYNEYLAAYLAGEDDNE